MTFLDRLISLREFLTAHPYLSVMVGSNADYFEQHKMLVRLLAPGPAVHTDSNGSEQVGLRKAQMGAAFAVAAHFTCRSDAALVTMPTGSGKSAVMTVVPFLLGSSRILVVTPSKLLREQLASEFLLLKVLRNRLVVPEEMAGPRVHVVTKRVDENAWRAMQDFDVVVGTPNVLSPGYHGIASPPEATFDLILLDEAHHSPAPTYQRLLEAFAGTPVVMFTATPFRRDKHQLSATSVYTYSLGQALDDNILAPIDFIPVDVQTATSDEPYDHALASAAATTLGSAEHQAARSRVIARTNTVNHAKELVKVYRETGVRMGLITASTSTKELRQILSQLHTGDLEGLVSVGVLGEGFDFPTLKIGVYHRRHASLPATLQFLGRLTRMVPNGPRACLLAVREEVNDETHELYASDTSWARLVPALADAAVDAEALRRTYLRAFDPDPTQPLSLSALTPRKDVKVFRLPPGVEINLRTSIEFLGGGDVIYHGTDDDGDLTVIVTEHLDRPEWMAADTLDRYRYELHVVVQDRQGAYLFVHGTRDATILTLVDLIADRELHQVPPEWLDRLMAGMQLVGYHSVGMRSARAAGGKQAAYRMMAGTNVGGAVFPAETRSYGTGHAIAQVRDPMRHPAEQNLSSPVTSIGVSFGRAKVFSPDHAQLLDFRNWCNRLSDLVIEHGATKVAGLPNLSLRSPRSIAVFPENPYLVTLEPILLHQGWHVRSLHSGVRRPLHELQLTATTTDPTCVALTAWLSDVPVWQGLIDIHGKVRSDDEEWVIEEAIGRDNTSIALFLSEEPPSVFFADGSSTIGAALFQGSDDYPDLSPSMLTVQLFTDVDIKAEAKDPRPGKMTIKAYVIEQFSHNAEVEYVIDDDRAGEIADLVVVHKPGSNGIRQIELVHLKYSSEDKPGARVADLYEVLGQAGRCVAWFQIDAVARRLLERLESGSYVAAGDPDQLRHLLAEWSSVPEPASWSVTVVQPGLSGAKANTKRNVKIMISDVLDWVSQHDAEFRMITHR